MMEINKWFCLPVVVLHLKDVYRCFSRSFWFQRSKMKRLLFVSLLQLTVCVKIGVDEEYVVNCANAKMQNQRLRRLLQLEQSIKGPEEVQPSFTTRTETMIKTFTTEIMTTATKTLNVRFGNKAIKTTIVKTGVETVTFTTSVPQVVSEISPTATRPCEPSITVTVTTTVRI